MKTNDLQTKTKALVRVHLAEQRAAALAAVEPPTPPRNEGETHMESWNDRITGAAKVLGLESDVLVAVLTHIGVDEATIKDVVYDDFKTEMHKHDNIRVLPGATIRLGPAFKLLRGEMAVLGDDTPLPDLVAVVNLVRPDDAARKSVALLKGRRVRSDEPRTWGDVHFIVLADDGSIDRTNTAAVMEALKSGAQDYTNGIFTAKDGGIHAVFRLDDLTLDSPRALRLKDPLDLGNHLDVNKVSRKFSTVVDLDAERHQLLLFAVERGLKAPPRDATEAGTLVAQMKATATVEDAAKSLGGAVEALWKAARRAQPGSPAALPAITEAGLGSGGAGQASNEGDAYAMLASPVPNEENIPLSLLPSGFIKAALATETRDHLRQFLLETCGESLSAASSKVECADAIVRHNPPLKDFYEFFVSPLLGDDDDDNRIGWNAYWIDSVAETAPPATEMLDEVVWRIFAKHALAKAKQ